MNDSISETLQRRQQTEPPIQKDIGSPTINISGGDTSKSDNCVYVFCPESDAVGIMTVLKRHSHIPVCLNDYSIRDFKNKTLCHFKSAQLSPEQQSFLVAATELGAQIEPLVSFLDRALGYTETELLHSGYFLHQKAFSILSSRKNSWEKRSIDLLFVFLLAWAAIPIGLFTALLIKLESGSSLLQTKKNGTV